MSSQVNVASNNATSPVVELASADPNPRGPDSFERVPACQRSQDKHILKGLARGHYPLSIVVHPHRAKTLPSHESDLHIRPPGGDAGLKKTTLAEKGFIKGRMLAPLLAFPPGLSGLAASPCEESVVCGLSHAALISRRETLHLLPPARAQKQRQDNGHDLPPDLLRQGTKSYRMHDLREAYHRAGFDSIVSYAASIMFIGSVIRPHV